MFDTLTVRGFAATKPDLRTLPDGTPVSSFRLASTPRRFDAESGSWVDVGPTNWYTVTCFRRLAGNAASSLKVGDAVLVMGRLRLRPWTTKEGIERLTVEIDATALGPDLALGTATYLRAGGASTGQSSHGSGAGEETGADEDETVDPMTGEVLERGDRDGTDEDSSSHDDESSWEGDPEQLLSGTSRSAVGV